MKKKKKNPYLLWHNQSCIIFKKDKYVTSKVVLPVPFAVCNVYGVKEEHECFTWSAKTYSHLNTIVNMPISGISAAEKSQQLECL